MKEKEKHTEIEREMERSEGNAKQCVLKVQSLSLRGKLHQAVYHLFPRVQQSVRQHTWGPLKVSLSIIYPQMSFIQLRTCFKGRNIYDANRRRDPRGLPQLVSLSSLCPSRCFNSDESCLDFEETDPESFVLIHFIYLTRRWSYQFNYNSTMLFDSTNVFA